MNKICWVLTPKCNYDCWFCRRHFNDIPEPSKDTIDKIIEFINNKNYETKLELDGGEPLLSTYIFNILSNVRVKYLSISTNLTPNLNFIVNLLSKFKIDYLGITFHAEFANPIEFYEKIKYLYSNKYRFRVKFTFEKNDYDYIMERYYPLYCKIYENFNNIDINNLIKINAGNYINIDNRIYKYFDKCRIIKKINVYSPYYNQLCKCHNDHITINYNGDVYPCISLLEKKESRLFSIMNSNINQKFLENISIRCTSLFCCEG